MSAAAQSPFLRDNFAPVHLEAEAADLKVIGEIPRELDGMFLRNGPNPQFDPPGTYHWFDGDGMLHGTQLRDGRATYRNRWIRTEGFEKEHAAGKAIWGGRFEMPQLDNPDGPFKNTGNAAVVHQADRLLTLWEGGPPHHVRAPSLETVGVHDFSGKLTCPMTAHPKVDPVTGEMVFFGYSPIPPFCTYGVVSARGEIVRLEPIELPSAVRMHDMAMTENFSVLLDLPLCFDLERAMRGEPPIYFDEERPARWGILPRHGDNSDLRWFETPSCYVFHTSNAYEDGDAVVLYGCRMERTDVLVEDGAQQDANNARMHRWRFDLASGQIQEERLDDMATDFPRVNESRLGRRNRYSFNAAFEREASQAPRFEGVTKYDQETGAIQRHLYGPNRFAGEAVFAPRPGATDEDDGWLMTFVHDERENSDELVILDGRDLTTGPLARVQIPTRVPYGFHAAWIPAEQYDD
jgi:carotenoid cleavage dioxygenase